MPHGQLPSRGVREVELAWIPMSDGVRLAARLFLPADAEGKPVPAILEYIPYRRRDSTRDGDNLTHPWFAENGYASVRLDIRGTGDSEGVIRDEYLKQEQDDAVEAIAWIAAQPWCSGSVGMMGISWGGFNSLQVAARRPPALKAIVTVCSTDDRYADDMHYMGGCLVTDTMAWGNSFFGRMARAPDPLMVGPERWREMWRERLEGWEPPFVAWLEHQRRDEFWKHGSVCEDYGDIECAVFAVGGWADGYSNAIFRMLANLKCPRLGLVGPWGHKYPHNGVPGPAIGFLQESKRFWDQWLKGQDTGIMNEPMLRAWVQESVPPAAHYDVRPGYWAAEAAWPGPTVRPQDWSLGRGTLAPASGAKGGGNVAVSITSPQSVGRHAGEWCPYGLGGISPELPLDQREEDSGSLVFDSMPLEHAVTILGAPVVELELEADQPTALVAVRLNDLRPDGGDLRVSYGVHNLTHRSGHEEVQPLAPGERVKVRAQLNEIGHIFPAGHVIRLAISTAYWPTIWPSPRPVRLTVHMAGSRLVLPVRERQAADTAVRFEPPAKGRPTARTVVQAPSQERTITQDVGTGEVIYTVVRDDGRSIIDEIGVETGFRKEVVYRIRPDDPTSASVRFHETLLHRHGQDWDSFVEAEARLTSTETDFVIEATLRATDAGKPFFARSWLTKIPRDGV